MAEACPKCGNASAEQVKAALDFYDRHAIGPDEVRYLMAYRRVPPEFREHVSALADLLLLRAATSGQLEQPMPGLPTLSLAPQQEERTPDD